MAAAETARRCIARLRHASKEKTSSALLHFEAERGCRLSAIASTTFCGYA
jgi:hypothetical protein